MRIQYGTILEGKAVNFMVEEVIVVFNPIEDEFETLLKLRDDKGVIADQKLKDMSDSLKNGNIKIKN